MPRVSLRIVRVAGKTFRPLLHAHLRRRYAAIKRPIGIRDAKSDAFIGSWYSTVYE